MTRSSEPDITNCEKAACIPGSTFSVSYRYSRPEYRNHLVCIRALHNEIRSIPFRVSEPEIAGIKIAWWRNELLTDASRSSQHPLVRGVQDCGVFANIDPSRLEAYFSSVSELASGEPIISVEQLVSHAKRIGGTEVLLECGEHSPPSASNAVIAIGQAAFLNRLLHDWYRRLCSENWWVPLDIQARYGISSNKNQLNNENHDIHLAIIEIAQLAKSHLCDGMKVIQSLDEVYQSNGLHHLMVNAVVINKRLIRLIRNPASTLSGQRRQIRYGLGENIAAWRQAIRN
jgi:phytoene/squalene synthetase